LGIGSIKKSRAISDCPLFFYKCALDGFTKYIITILFGQKRSQHSVQLTVGRRRVFQVFFGLWAFSVSTASPPSHPPQLTHTVETVEKVSFQNMIFEKWERNA
jgi:hypothetical protein